MDCKSLIGEKLYCKSRWREGPEVQRKRLVVEDGSYGRRRHGSQQNSVSIVTGRIDEALHACSSNHGKAIRRCRSQAGPNVPNWKIPEMRRELLRLFEEAAHSGWSNTPIETHVFIGRTNN